MVRGNSGMLTGRSRFLLQRLRKMPICIFACARTDWRKRDDSFAPQLASLESSTNRGRMTCKPEATINNSPYHSQSCPVGIGCVKAISHHLERECTCVLIADMLIRFCEQARMATQ